MLIKLLFWCSYLTEHGVGEVQELTPHYKDDVLQSQAHLLSLLCKDEYSYRIVKPMEWQLAFCSLCRRISYTVNTGGCVCLCTYPCVLNPVMMISLTSLPTGDSVMSERLIWIVRPHRVRAERCGYTSIYFIFSQHILFPPIKRDFLERVGVSWVKGESV